MDEPKMSHALEVNDFSGTELREIETAVGSKPGGKRFAWESYIRCLLIIAIASLVGCMAWRPGVLRFSLLMSMVSPSRGDSLAWKPEEEAVLPRAQRKFTPSPPEWRLTAGHSKAWEAQSAGASLVPHWQGGNLPSASWSRSSANPWSWQDDVVTRSRRHPDAEGTPSQKPASDFRARDTDNWGTRQSIAAATPATRTPSSRTVPELSPLPGSDAVAERIRQSPQLPLTPTGPATESRTTLELPPLSLPDQSNAATGRRMEAGTAPGSVGRAETTTSIPVISLEPLNFDAISPESAPTPVPTLMAPVSASPQPTETTTMSLPPLNIPNLPGQFTDPVFPEEMPEPTAPAAQVSPASAEPAIARDGPESQQETEVAGPVSTDWKNREITDRIPGAYLTVYPKLKFVGLCVPGEGYIRKYNQVAVPRDTMSQPKTAAADGLTPYGKYYVAGRSRGPEGARLALSWPSPDDARRIGLPPDQVTAVEMAWLDRSPVPQDTAAAGGVALTGLRRWLESTDGGFALEEPHMEEIYTALPDGAWVFVQQ